MLVKPSDGAQRLVLGGSGYVASHGKVSQKLPGFVLATAVRVGHAPAKVLAKPVQVAAARLA